MCTSIQVILPTSMNKWILLRGFLRPSPDHVKIANQHNPAYYVCVTGQDSAVQQTLAKWVPLFDKYRYMTVFENHEHSFKKSYPLTC